MTIWRRHFEKGLLGRDKYIKMLPMGKEDLLKHYRLEKRNFIIGRKR